MYLLEGPKSIEDALARGAAIRWLVASEEGWPAVEGWRAAGLLRPDVEIHRVPAEELAAMADTVTPQGILAAGAIPPRGLDALPEDVGRLALLVDGVQDPGNLGTLLRTLAAAGGRVAICVKGTVDPFNPKALRGAAGATFALSIAFGVERGEAIEWCAGRGIPIVALEARGPSLFDADPPDPPVALAVGGEAAGLGVGLLDRAARVVGLPMEAGVESLSAAVAGSIAMYALTLDRTSAKGSR